MSTSHLDANEINRRFYEDEATTHYYSCVEGLTYAERPIFTRHLRAGMDILDLGVGAGRTTPFLSDKARTYVGIDYAETMVDICRRRFPDLRFEHADAADLSFVDDNSFDAAVFSYNGIDYLSPAANRLRCLQECHRVLRPGGVLIFSRHNPRALVRWPELGGRELRRQIELLARLPVWTLRRAVRLAPYQAFWRGAGAVPEAPNGFTGPLFSSKGRRRQDGRSDVLTEMAVPRSVTRELARCGFTVTEVAGGVDVDRTAILSTPYYQYVATKPASSHATAAGVPAAAG